MSSRRRHRGGRFSMAARDEECRSSNGDRINDLVQLAFDRHFIKAMKLQPNTQVPGPQCSQEQRTN
uniref:Uncharacterized protein n=1 Tax=Leersia perrieri TaxID=77586 RepID=A0A0D9XWD8_9ORYZ